MAQHPHELVDEDVLEVLQSERLADELTHEQIQFLLVLFSASEHEFGQLVCQIDQSSFFTGAVFEKGVEYVPIEIHLGFDSSTVYLAESTVHHTSHDSGFSYASL